MRNLLVHGCYDQETLNTLTTLGIGRLAFDLRAKSPNLVPFRELRILLEKVDAKEVILMFEDEKEATVLSFLDLLKSSSVQVILEFRDRRDLHFYHSINHPFFWMFDPSADWENIVLLPKLKGVLLPIHLRSEYGRWPALWDVFERRNLEVLIHASSLKEAMTIDDFTDLNLSVDLNAEIEKSFRCVDQERLKQMQLWRKLNENPVF